MGCSAFTVSRRRFLVASLDLAAIGLLAGCGGLPGPGRGAGRTPRIGFLQVGSREGRAGLIDGFLDGLREEGYVDGQNIVIEYRFSGDRDDRLSALAAELIQLPVELLVAGASPAVNAAKQATDRIPIVMPVSGDPVGQGYVASLARPGGNITGLTTMSSSELSRKRLQLLKEVAPAVSRVAVLWNPNNSAKVLDFKQTQVAAETLGLTLHSLEVRGPSDFEAAWQAATAGGSEALDTLAEPLITAQARQIADFALKLGWPSVSEPRELADAGGLIAYGPNSPDLYRRSASYVAKILKGANPAELPVEQPAKFDFVLNLKTAQALGLAIPPSVVAQASEVIQ
jgi:ABC-type uncharacterized transport system substrate-binding protein